ncbi:MAG TPA: GDP-mannose 4,6-dehydratase [Solirubrobacteraceae bacterium]|jgi:dTDP-glucose 4,6-dehydratase|nr:GDP-mannose 4,6-dehydratase [Solirubrobacteraceae bacterium]
MARNVLVTGGSGFIGSHLCEALVRRGDTVRALVHYNGRGGLGRLASVPSEIRNEIEVVSGDITDPYALRDVVSGRDVVFHLAALIAIPYSYLAPYSFFLTNTLGTVHVLQAARDEDVGRIVHVSTSECYGSAQTIPISEAHPLVAQSPYAASKIGADQAAGSFCRSFDLPVVIVRPFNTFGPRQSARAIIPTIITQALTDGTVRLGALDPTRDLTFVTDTAAGMIAAAEAPGVIGETINLGAGEHISIGDLAARIFDLLEQSGVHAHIEHDTDRVRPPGSEVERLCSDPSKARRLLGWEPEVSLTDGLSATIAAIRSDLDSYPRVGTYQR